MKPAEWCWCGHHVSAKNHGHGLLRFAWLLVGFLWLCLAGLGASWLWVTLT